MISEYPSPSIPKFDTESYAQSPFESAGFRDERLKAIATDTLQILQDGKYTTQGGRTVDIGQEMARAVALQTQSFILLGAIKEWPSPRVSVMCWTR